MVRVTFTLDEATVATLRRTAARLHKPQSRVVREAIGEYAARAGKLSEEERARMLKIFDTSSRPSPNVPCGRSKPNCERSAVPAAAGAATRTPSADPSRYVIARRRPHGTTSIRCRPPPSPRTRRASDAQRAGAL
ncbi:MAG: hypothetical protein DME13_16920 [Candidatus Rokuibacteriota bacterium]|nr:MAG: hypothetical protein DME13_16920 [Candidatus Rokubacteria bacterium]